MTMSTNGSAAAVTAQEIDLSGPRTVAPVGTPAGVIGTANKGPAFVPVTVGIDQDFYAKFGNTDGVKFGPIAAVKWLKNQQALTYLRVLGAGDGTARATDGSNIGSVNNAGFIVGDEQPDPSGGLVTNPNANADGPLGRLFFLGAFMSESAGSTVFSDAGSQTSATAIPILRGVVMAASGVLLRLSSSYVGTSNISATTIGSDATAKGQLIGSVKLLDGLQAKQEFVLLLNGHKGADPSYPYAITASFDSTAPNYFGNVFNRDPYKLQTAGHYLYANFDVPQVSSVVTGSGLILDSASAGGTATGVETAAFITTGSLARDVGGAYVPNYENWNDRFSAGRTPWIISQKFGGVSQNLFRIWLVSDGANTTNQIKISIENPTPSTDPSNLYGTFDVVVRDYSDRDTNVSYLEQWRGLTLDPNSSKYVARVIGDQHIYFDFEHAADEQRLVIDGSYENASNYIRIEVDSAVDAGEVDETALPMGFRGHVHLITSGSTPLTAPTTADMLVSGVLKSTVQPPVPMRSTIAAGSGPTQVVNPSYYWGVQFEKVTSLLTPNASTAKESTVASFTQYFPDFQVVNLNVTAHDNSGVADTTQLGTTDVDRFNNNIFTLENIQVVTNSAGYADSQKWVSAEYVRNGHITPDDTAKTRAFNVNDLTQQSNRRFAKFSVFAQGGFDGVNIFDPEASQLTNIAVTQEMNNVSRGLTAGPTVSAFQKAIDIAHDATDVDIKLLAIPGIRNPIVTDYATTAIEDRFDAFYIMDIEEYDSLDNLVTDDATQQPSVKFTSDEFAARGINSSFAAAYFPDVVTTDPVLDVSVEVPPSVAVLGAFGYNDAVAYPWYAPAGFARGALADVTEAVVKLKQEDMDALAAVDINPLVAFPGTTRTAAAPGGVVVWGQKTLYQVASSLDRINVRRLLIELRRSVREVGQTVLFEPDLAATLKQFSDKVKPIFAKVQLQNGLNNYKIVIDMTTTTQNDIDNNTIRGEIIVWPKKTIEKVSLGFVVTNTAATV